MVRNQISFQFVDFRGVFSFFMTLGTPTAHVSEKMLFEKSEKTEILEHIRSHNMIITSDLIQCSPSRLTMQMSVSPVHPSRLSRIVKTPEINSTHRDLILIQILVSNSKKYSRTSILNFRANIGFTPSSRVCTGRGNFKTYP